MPKSNGFAVNALFIWLKRKAFPKHPSTSTLKVCLSPGFDLTGFARFQVLWVSKQSSARNKPRSAISGQGEKNVESRPDSSIPNAIFPRFFFKYFASAGGKGQSRGPCCCARAQICRRAHK